MIFRFEQQVAFGVYERNVPLYNKWGLRHAFSFIKTSHGLHIAYHHINEKIYKENNTYLFKNWDTKGWGWLGISKTSLRVGLVVGETSNNYDFYVLKDEGTNVWIGNVMSIAKESIERLPRPFAIEIPGKLENTFCEL